jgi:uncharacterized protein (DUF1778 family)
VDRDLLIVSLDSAEVLREERLVAEMKDQKRLDLRVSSEEKETITRAAALSGHTISEFIRGTMLAAANKEIRDHEVIQLTNEGSRAFVAALMDPPEPNENLHRLARESRLARPPRDSGETDRESVTETPVS